MITQSAFVKELLSLLHNRIELETHYGLAGHGGLEFSLFDLLTHSVGVNAGYLNQKYGTHYQAEVMQTQDVIKLRVNGTAYPLDVQQSNHEDFSAENISHS